MVTRYFILQENLDPNTALPITPAHDVLSLSALKTFFRIGGFTHEDQEYHVYNALLPQDIIEELWWQVEGDPLTLAATEFLGIQGIYGGSDHIELCAIVQARFGIDLSGTRAVEDEFGNTIEVPLLTPNQIL